MEPFLPEPEEEGVPRLGVQLDASQMLAPTYEGSIPF